MDPFLWFANREVSLCPPHFIKCNTPVTEKSLFWVKTKTYSRYCLVNSIISADSDLLANHENTYIYFEDPKDATFYEIRWAGNK